MKLNMIQNTCGNNFNNVSPSGLEYQQSQCPVADATGNDVPPSGLILEVALNPNGRSPS
jgi:hypothetical protein